MVDFVLVGEGTGCGAGRAEAGEEDVWDGSECREVGGPGGRVVGSYGVEFCRLGAGRAAGESGDLGGEGVVEKGLEHVIALGEEVRGWQLGLGLEELTTRPVLPTTTAEMAEAAMITELAGYGK